MSENLKLVAIIPDCDNQTEVLFQFNRPPTRDEFKQIQRCVDDEGDRRSDTQIGYRAGWKDAIDAVWVVLSTAPKAGDPPLPDVKLTLDGLRQTVNNQTK